MGEDLQVVDREQQVQVVVRSRLLVQGLGPAEEAELAALFSYPNPARRGADRLRQVVRRLQGPARKRAWAMLMAAERAPAELTTWRREPGGISVPRGGMGRLREVLLGAGLEYVVRDERCEGDPALAVPAGWQHRVELRDFQRDLVAVAERRENCLWRSAAGSGKTTAGIALALKVRLPTLVIVWTGAVFGQWLERLRQEAGVVAGQIRGGVVRLGPITVAMQQSLHRRLQSDPGLAERWGLVVADEVDRYGAGTFQQVIDRLPARYRVGMSDDERRKDRREVLIYDQFGAVAHEVPRAPLVERGIIHDVVLRVIPTGFNPAWYRALPPEGRPAAYDQLLQELVADLDRTGLATQAVAEAVRQGHQVLVFSSRVAHCRQLEADVRVACRELPGEATGLLLGGTEQEGEAARVRAGLRAGAVRVAVGTYQAITYGLDLPAVSRGVAATPCHSNRATLRQTCGRLARRAAGKVDAVLYYLLDPCFGQRALAQLCHWAKQVYVLQPGGEWVEGRALLGRNQEGCGRNGDPEE